MKILIFTDHFNLGQRIIPKALESMGVETVFARTPLNAAKALNDNEVDLTLIDGDLGDDDCGTESISGEFIKEHLLDKRPFARMTRSPRHIPKIHQGLFVWDKMEGKELRSLIKASVPS